MRMVGYLVFFLGLMSAQSVSGAHIDTLQVASAAMGHHFPCLVVLPESYGPAEPPFPVVYLLHGHSGDYKGWLGDAPRLPELADRYGIILVCPDGGFDSWYFDSPVDPKVRFETHVAQEVVSQIDYLYNTRRDRQGRAIAGLSMGGHGALWLASRHPDLFGAAGSMCGGLDLRPFRKNDWDLEGVLGNPDKFWDNWESHTVVNQAPRFREGHVQLIVDCGSADFFLEGNRLFHQRLVEAGVPHTYTERPGAHEAAYWREAVEDVLLYLDRFFNKSAARSSH